MGVVVEKGVITAPASTGQQTYNLGSAFNGILPKALTLWATYETADAAVDGDAIFSVGFGTYRGSVVQQAFAAMFSDDAGTAASTDISLDTDAILEGLTIEGTEATARDYSVDLVSLNSGTPSNFVLDWTDAPASQIKIHYWIIGGSDVDDAVVGSFATTVGVATQDVALPSGFGTPDANDLILFLTHGHTGSYHRSDANISLGACRGDGSQPRASVFVDADNAPSMTCGAWQKARALLVMLSAASADAEADVTSGAPTDNFRLSYTDQASQLTLVKYLVIRLSANATLDIGSNTAPTSGSPPVTQDNATSGTPKGALVWGNNLATQSGINTTDADLGATVLGGTDGSNEGMAGRSQDDGNANAVTGRYFRSDKTLAFYTPTATPTLQSEADGSFSGSNFRLSWTDIDAVAREYNWLVIGEAAGGQIVAIGQVTETNLAQAISVNPLRRLVGQVTETDLAQAVTPLRTYVVGQVTETDFAQAVAVNPLRRLIEQASETNLAQAITARKTVTVGQVLETDFAQEVTEPGAQIVPVGQVTETDLAQPVVVNPLRRLIGQVLETDLAQAITSRRTYAVGQVLETDLAQAVAVNPIRRLIGQVLETNIAQPITVAGEEPSVVQFVYHVIQSLFKKRWERIR